MSTLYDLTQDIMVLLEMAEDPEVDAETLADTMEAVEGEFEVKAEGYAMVIKELEAEEEKFANEIKRLTEKKRTISNNVDRIKRNLENAMLTTGKKKFKTDKFSFSIQKNPASVKIIGDVPEEYLTYKDPEPNKKAIKDALNNGAELAFAELVQTEGLRIR